LSEAMLAGAGVGTAGPSGLRGTGRGPRRAQEGDAAGARPISGGVCPGWDVPTARARRPRKGRAPGFPTGVRRGGSGRPGVGGPLMERAGNAENLAPAYVEALAPRKIEPREGTKTGPLDPRPERSLRPGFPRKPAGPRSKAWAPAAKKRETLRALRRPPPVWRGRGGKGRRRGTSGLTGGGRSVHERGPLRPSGRKDQAAPRRWPVFADPRVPLQSPAVSGTN